jgi:predicted transcriptional regulator of viral defense system
MGDRFPVCSQNNKLQAHMDLTRRAYKRDSIPYMRSANKVRTADYFATRPVFSLEDAARALAPPRGRVGTVERLKHHLETGRLKLVERGLYAVVPPGISAERFQPDPFLVAKAARPDGIFSHHSALELLGVAHSTWSRFTLYTARRRKLLAMAGATIRFLDHPGPFRSEPHRPMGVRKIERRGTMIQATGPERTLVEGFRRPALAGGLEELVYSASAFPTLDLDLLDAVLLRYGIANLWAATGWFLERFQRSFSPPESFLARIERNRPRSPQYLERGRRGGTLVARWNLILPDVLLRPGAADES